MIPYAFLSGELLVCFLSVPKSLVGTDIVGFFIAKSLGSLSDKTDSSDFWQSQTPCNCEAT
jgi:hypothetical protein